MTMMLSATLNETRKGLIILWDYKLSLLVEWLGILLIFVGIMFFVGQGEITDQQVASTVLGFVVTFYALNAIGNMSWSLMEEAQAGTLEQMYMSPAPSQLIILGRSLASLVTTTVQMLLITGIILLVFSVQLGLSLNVVPVLLITIVGLLGFGYMIGGMTLIFKRVGPLANIVQNFLLIANGTFLPIEYMPGWMATIVTLLPSTQGIVLMRRIVLDSASLAEIWTDGGLPFLVVHSLIFFVLGWFVYMWCEGIARRQGSLGQY